MKLLILLALVAVSFGQNTPRVKLDIYYEALCPDTFAYINQLSAVYSSFRNNLDITYIPFGKGNVSVLNKKFLGETDTFCIFRAQL